MGSRFKVKHKIPVRVTCSFFIRMHELGNPTWVDLSCQGYYLLRVARRLEEYNIMCIKADVSCFRCLRKAMLDFI